MLRLGHIQVLFCSPVGVRLGILYANICICREKYSPVRKKYVRFGVIFLKSGKIDGVGQGFLV